MKARFLSTILMGCFAMACGGAEGGTDADSGNDSDDPTMAMDEPIDENPSDEDTTADPTEQGTELAKSDEIEPGNDEEVVDEEAVDEDVADENEETDTTAPTIVSLLPEDGAKGVFADDVIVIEFSEPMDQDATEAAYVSSDLPHEEVTFEWNDEGTELTIIPNEELEYSTGWIPENVTAKNYAYALGGKDLAGNTLEGVQVSFDTGRLILAQAPVFPGATGAVRVGTGDTDGSFGSGDTADGDFYRGFISFVLPELPENRLAMLALFQTQQVQVEGAPFTNLVDDDHALCLMAESFLTVEQVQNLTPSEPIGDLSSQAENGERSVDVTATVEALYEQEENWAQFIIQFAVPTDGVGFTDAVIFDTAQTWIAIGSLIE